MVDGLWQCFKILGIGWENGPQNIVFQSRTQKSCVLTKLGLLENVNILGNSLFTVGAFGDLAALSLIRN